MTVPGWGPVVLDLQGWNASDQVRLLVDHDPHLRGIMGQGRASIESGEVRVEGSVLRSSMQGERAIAMARDGFQWQASVGVKPEQVERGAAGQAVEVNGRRIESDGPFKLIRKGVLKEVSFLALGADAEGTQVRIRGNLMNDQNGNVSNIDTMRSA